ncbi:hypothetical protein SAMN04488032_101144 [Pacificibacter marinus]|uniref:Integral membrane protein TerC family protein n=2 Tax=Pacificibacter marinus TaxID=658057 RepID=A0A1Y5RJ70_9RHOB|nr:DUF475 domain-containing protein [Pacificibacter marinus]SEK18299.1 hypothetical protein SAMN04488032_101144 [Pacificibacter marinus]SLN18828.1 Integral membrane protein TerC family protein [Pacificibacter marinus]
MKTTMHYFRWSFLITVLGLIAAYWLGWKTEGTASGAVTFLLIGAVLVVLEISLSFDNAIVNANKLKTMSPLWQRRFLTWGILIAVFGMRIIFPLVIVAIAAWVGPFEALHLAISEPQEYARLMQESHLSISAFGGTFLMLVALDFFIDHEKDIDWLCSIEKNLKKGAAIKGLGYGMVLFAILIFGSFLPEAKQSEFFVPALVGAVVFLCVDGLSHILDSSDVVDSGAAMGGARQGTFGAFLYLEVLDASFSFDGVIGAFALTQNLFLIAIGLGVGAMYVRSMTIMLVEKKTLNAFRYLEHGAFYSILALSLIMFAQSAVHVPEVITGLIGAAIIGTSLLSSLRFNRQGKA